MKAGFHPHFPDEETETQRGREEFELGLSDFKIPLIIVPWSRGRRRPDDRD